MASTVALVDPSHTKLDYIKRQIIAGYERTLKAGMEWIEGSLIMGAALREARVAIPADIGFKDWLKQNKLEFLPYHDRAALINLAGNLELMRTILTETDSRSYRLIWQANKGRFDSTVKPRKPRVGKPRKKGRGMIYREMKLGTETMQKIKGTSLDSAEEMDELIMLNRGAAPGELTPIVMQLVADASNGNDVSAIVSGKARKTAPLTQAWRKRMVASWLAANKEERSALIKYLTEHLEDKT